jgi:arsenate reductase
MKRSDHHVSIRFRFSSSVLPEERREPLDRLAQFVMERRERGEAARLLFICTHNSRRSHMGQIWASVAAAHHGIDGVETFSGGTEATAFDPRAVAALRRAGIGIEATNGDAANPRYAVSFADSRPALEAFSKKYDDPPNPTEGFAAIMTCSEADQACPFVQGAALRVALPYADPKASDGTPREEATYDERCQQIATEMFYLFSRVAS